MQTVRSIDAPPAGTTVLMEGLPIEPGLADAINFEVERAVDRRTPTWRRHLLNAGTLAAFLAALGAAFSRNVPPVAAVPIALMILVGWALVIRRLQARKRRSVRWEVMARHGLPICAGCGYNLTALQSQRCPECGRSAR